MRIESTCEGKMSKREEKGGEVGGVRECHPLAGKCVD